MSADFDRLWSEIEPVGRDESTGGYRRFAWTAADATLRDWFTATATARGLDVTEDRAGNQWAWWGSPDSAPGVVTGSHLDSVPDGGAFDGPLGVVSAFAAVDALREEGFVPSRAIGIVNFADEEGGRFGVACAGSRLLTGRLDPHRARSLQDADGLTLADALTATGRDPAALGADDDALKRIGVYVELHLEQGRGLADLDAPIAVAQAIWPHGRWRVDLAGEANHAGTTRLQDRQDPTLGYARLVLGARASAARRGAVATCGKVRIVPNAVNAIPSHVTAWLDVRGPDAQKVHGVLRDVTEMTANDGATITEESWTDETVFDSALRDRLVAGLGAVPVLSTGAGHDAGILANTGIPAAMLFVRNPTGISHSPAEFAERADCLAGVAALTTVLADLSG